MKRLFFFWMLTFVIAAAAGSVAASQVQPAGARQLSRNYHAPVMRHDSDFDLGSIPLREWLSGEDAAEIPWNTQIESPELRMDQRMEIAYVASVRGRDLNRIGGPHNLVFISGISRDDGEWVTPPKVVRHEASEKLSEEFQIRFSDWVFVQPGQYQLWLVLYHGDKGRHSVTKRRVRVSQPQNDPMPDIASRLPLAEFPAVSEREGDDYPVYPDALFLPVANKRPLRVELFSVVSPPDQWADLQSPILRTRAQTMVTALATLAQMKLANGGITMTGVDVLRHEWPFTAVDFQDFGADKMESAFRSAANRTVSVVDLGRHRMGANYLRDALTKRLSGSRERPVVMIIAASSFVFERGSEVKAVRLEEDCNCRVFHLRFRHDPTDVFDEIEDLIRPLRPTTFNITSPNQFRRALAAIVAGIETY